MAISSAEVYVKILYGSCNETNYKISCVWYSPTIFAVKLAPRKPPKPRPPLVTRGLKA